MAWSKRQLIAEAFAELALAGYVYDISPEEEQSAARRLDTLMGTWLAQGVQVAYSFSADSTGADLDADSGLSLMAVEAVYMALALRIAAGKGKAVPQTSKAAAKASYDALVSRLAIEQSQPQQLRSGVPKGAGSRPRLVPNQPFLTNPNTTPIQNASDGGLTLTGN